MSHEILKVLKTWQFHYCNKVYSVELAGAGFKVNGLLLSKTFFRKIIVLSKTTQENLKAK